MATDNKEKKTVSTNKKSTTKTTRAKTSAKTTTGTKKKTTSTKGTKPVAKTTNKVASNNRRSAANSKKTTAKTVKKTAAPKKKETKPVEIDLTQDIENSASKEVVSELHIPENNLETKPQEREDNKKGVDTYEITSILGAKLPTGNNAEDKKVRKRFYLKDSLAFAIIIPLIDLLAMFFFEPYKPFNITDVEWMNYGINLIFDFVVIFLITYVIDYALSEDDVKKNTR